MNKYQRSKAEALEAQIKELADKCKLDSWTSFVENMQVPMDIYPALMTNRPELLKAAPPRALSKDECAVLYRVLAGMMETNAALRQHAEQTALLVDNWAQAFKHLRTLGDRIQRFASFRRQEDEEDEVEAA